MSRACSLRDGAPDRGEYRGLQELLPSRGADKAYTNDGAAQTKDQLSLAEAALRLMASLGQAGRPAPSPEPPSAAQAQKPSEAADLAPKCIALGVRFYGEGCLAQKSIFVIGIPSPKHAP